jgi:penicillin V acylase-like amidase (Ntn superfamily)
MVPKCFGSTQNDSRQKCSEESVPNARYPSKSSKRKKSIMNSSLFNTTIMRTVDMTIEDAAEADDEVQLVDFQKNRANTTTRSLQSSVVDNKKDEISRHKH